MKRYALTPGFRSGPFRAKVKNAKFHNYCNVSFALSFKTETGTTAGGIFANLGIVKYLWAYSYTGRV